MSRDAREPGFFDAVRATGATLLELVEVRAALFGVELREEVARRKRSLLLAACASAFLHLALLLVTFLVAAIFWDTHRIVAIAGMATAYLACAGVLFAILRLDASARAPAFAATLSEFERDLRELRTER